MAAERTEKATPKRRDEARKKGQVARSADVGGAVVMITSVFALSAFGPKLVERAELSMRQTLALTANPDAVTGPALRTLLESSGTTVAYAVAPLALCCMLAGVAASIAQVRWRPSPAALKPDPRRINPLQGAKNIFGPNAFFEGSKTLLKVAIVGGITALAVVPRLTDLAALVGTPPEQLFPMLAQAVLDIVRRAAIAYVAIAALDYAWQRWRHEKSLRMDKQEVKEEHKQHSLPPEVRSAMRRRQVQAARARMMAAVPQADVVVTNPTHYAVALRYDGTRPAPEVVAKGQDLVALQIRRIAEEHGVPVMQDPPLARAIHGSVEIGGLIPEELFQGVAQVLAYVYKVAGRRVA
jgi:flagellar biosynthesis protein FlhB